MGNMGICQLGSLWRKRERYQETIQIGNTGVLPTQGPVNVTALRSRWHCMWYRGRKLDDLAATLGLVISIENCDQPLGFVYNCIIEGLIDSPISCSNICQNYGKIRVLKTMQFLAMLQQVQFPWQAKHTRILLTRRYDQFDTKVEK